MAQGGGRSKVILDVISQLQLILVFIAVLPACWEQGYKKGPVSSINDLVPIFVSLWDGLDDASGSPGTGNKVYVFLFLL